MTQPGRYLPHFIDWMEQVAFAPPALKSVYRETLAHMKRANRRGVRFALGDKLPGVLPDGKLLVGADLRPPYPITVVEYLDGSCHNVIVAEDLGSHVKLRAYAAPTGRDVAICPFELRLEYLEHAVPIELRCWATPLVDATADMLHKTHDELFRNAATLLDGVTSLYARLCAVLENNHVETHDVEPDAKENRIRRIRGKAPLYTYKTLTIGAPKTRQVGVGRGTHASPRSHLRRGFYRTSKNGVRHWVQATMVKGETPGFVHKDYQVEQKGLNNG